MIEPVQTVEIKSAPVVPGFKSNGAVRICRDIIVNVNSYPDMQCFPLTHPEELCAALSSGKLVLEIDLADANL